MYRNYSSSNSDMPPVVYLEKTTKLIETNLARPARAPKNSSETCELATFSDSDTLTNEPISDYITKEHINKKPHPLPSKEFTWCTIALQDPVQLNELRQLLSDNYVEDVDNMFRMDYSPDFLRWALMPPGWLSQWHVGVRTTADRKLAAFIAAIPASVRVYGQTVRMAEVSFLCVHKKWRSMRLTPALLGELTRRCHLEGVFQAVCTTGAMLSQPVGVCRYWQRMINTKKLIDVEFFPLPRNMTVDLAIRLYQLPLMPRLAGFRRFDPARDGEQAFLLLTSYLRKFYLTLELSFESFLHWFSPQNGVVDSYVVADYSGRVKDFVSFYSVQAFALQRADHTNIRIAYAFYSVAGSVPLRELMYDALIAAKRQGYDVFFALDVMDNRDFLEPLQFAVAHGQLNYYFYNWKCPFIGTPNIGLVLR